MTGTTWRCAACDTNNASGIRECGICGTAAPAKPSGGGKGAKGAARPPRPWKCRTCDTNNKASAATCMVCGRKRPVPKPPPRPKTPWPCPECETVNAASSLTCMVCDANWRRPAKPTATKPTGAKPAGAKPPPPPKSTPRTPPGPRSTGSAGPSSATGLTSGSGTRATTPPSSSGAAPRTGTRTGKPHPAWGTPPPTYPVPPTYSAPPTFSAPPRSTASMSAYPPPIRFAPPASRKRRGWRFWVKVARWSVAVLMFLAVTGLGARACHALGNAVGSQVSPSPAVTRSAAPCPPAAAARLPDADGAVLVADYRTTNKVIILCRENSGKVYYYGAFSGRPSTGMAFPATRTAGGYTAHNGDYTYRVDGRVVTVDLGGRRIDTEHLTPAPHTA